jgi:hypothetical protein
MSNVVYVIQNNYVSNQFKIGITSNWSQRSKQLKVGNVTTEIFVGNVNNNHEVEKQLHKRYANYRLPQSEWFHLNDEQLDDVITIIGRNAPKRKLEAKPKVEYKVINGRKVPAYLHNTPEYKAAWAEFHKEMCEGLGVDHRDYATTTEFLRQLDAKLEVYVAERNQVKVQHKEAPTLVKKSWVDSFVPKIGIVMATAGLTTVATGLIGLALHGIIIATSGLTHVVHNEVLYFNNKQAQVK